MNSPRSCYVMPSAVRQTAQNPHLDIGLPWFQSYKKPYFCYKLLSTGYSAIAAQNRLRQQPYRHSKAQFFKEPRRGVDSVFGKDKELLTPCLKDYVGGSCDHAQDFSDKSALLTLVSEPWVILSDQLIYSLGSPFLSRYPQGATYLCRETHPLSSFRAPFHSGLSFGFPEDVTRQCQFHAVVFQSAVGWGRFSMSSSSCLSLLQQLPFCC